MKILSVNAGSSSLKFQMYEMPEEKVLISGVFERIGIEGGMYTIKINGEKIKKETHLKDHAVAVNILLQELIENKVIENLDEIKGVGHRLVHGGDKYNESILINNDVIDTLKELIPLAPLHNPANIIGVETFIKAIPNAVQVGCFDTAFHQTMEEENFLYTVPYEWYKEYGVRKYGFHGLSHKYVSERLSEIIGKKESNLIICHLGNGGSISAVVNGKCINTTMGFTPNAGIMMGSRSGDIDYSLIPYMIKQTGMNIDEIDNALNKKSGLLGISGVSSDSRDVENGIEEEDKRCELAQKMYVRRVIDYIAKYYVQLGNVDAIAFTAGVGENSISTRKQIIDGLKALDIKIDEEKNNVRGKEQLITAKESKVPCYCIPTDEEVMIARDTYRLSNK